MAIPDDIEDLPEELARAHLPEALKDTCIVLPKRLFQWGSVNVMLVGVGIGMLIGALLHAHSPWFVGLGFPLSIGLAWCVGRLILTRIERKFYRAVKGEDGAESQS